MIETIFYVLETNYSFLLWQVVAVVLDFFSVQFWVEGSRSLGECPADACWARL